MKFLSALMCVILLAGAHASISVSRNSGEEYTFTVVVFPESIASCHLKTPNGVTYDFIPGEASPHGDRYELLPIQSMAACSITVTNLQESDTGAWQASFVSTTGSGSYQNFDLTVTRAEIQQTEDENIKWLNIIEHPSRTGQIIDISLPKISQEEKCTIRSPDGDSLRASEMSLDGVIVQPTSSFVSCRITVGPMSEDLIGDWAVCGEYTENGEGHKRCQPVKIYWNTNNRPDSIWPTHIQPHFEHSVHFGKMLAPTVIGQGDVVSCHIVTPNGEDLVITQDTLYPYLSAQNIAHSICNIAIGPINEEFLGSWNIYGLYRNEVYGLNEVRLPFDMFLYDEENPYDQAYNVTDLGAAKRVVNIGNTLYTDVSVTAGQVEDCIFETPSGDSYTIETQHSFSGASFVDVTESGIACQLAIGPITAELLGDWKLIGKFSNNGIFTELHQIFHVIQEDPENPIGEDRDIHYLDPQIIKTAIGGTHRLVIHTNEFIHGESCHLRTPDDLQYTIMEGFSLEGVEAIVDSGVECGVLINVVSEEVIGEWTLIARSTRFSEAIERRLPFTIYVEVSGGNIDSGDFMTTLDLIRDRSVEKLVGPENAVYCRLEDPEGFAVFDGFGRCNLSLDKVGLEHNGVWKMFVGISGRVLTHDYQLYVTVKQSEGKAVVTTHVEKERPDVIISCAVQTAAEVHACKFRDAQGRILLAANGVSEDRYEFHGSEVSYESEVKTHECGLRITNPLVSDLGMWRCAIETSEDTYYGHMPVLCPWNLQDPAVAATVQQVPILTSDRSLVSVVEEEPALVSCSVQSAIRYCYFRASNGTTFTVTPGMSTSSMQYVGAGFDAGECGLRFKSMRASDGGRWSCHVGLVGDHEEHRDFFQLTVHERMRVNHFIGHGNVMTVEGIVHEGRALEYCRFVRIDGFGFTTDSVPSEYTMTGLLANGECQFTGSNPTILDIHPWTVVAKIRGQDEEIARDTMNAIIISPPETETDPDSPDHPDHEEIEVIFASRNGFQIFFYTFIVVLLVAVLLGIWLGPKKHREWTYRRASSIRSSFTNSLRKNQHTPSTPHV